MASPNRLEQRKQQTHQHLLEAASKVFSQMGYMNASILDITEAANVSKRTFYLHFSDKEALLIELALQYMQFAREKIETDLCDWEDASMRDRLYQVNKSMFEFAQNNPEIMRIAFVKGGSLRLNDMVREYLALSMTSSVSTYIPPSWLGGLYAEILPQTKAGAIFQVLSWWVQNDYAQTPEELAEIVTQIMYDGMAILYQDGETPPTCEPPSS